MPQWASAWRKQLLAAPPPLLANVSEKLINVKPPLPQMPKLKTIT